MASQFFFLFFFLPSFRLEKKVYEIIFFSYHGFVHNGQVYSNLEKKYRKEYASFLGGGVMGGLFSTSLLCVFQRGVSMCKMATQGRRSSFCSPPPPSFPPSCTTTAPSPPFYLPYSASLHCLAMYSVFVFPPFSQPPVLFHTTFIFKKVP